MSKGRGKYAGRSLTSADRVRFTMIAIIPLLACLIGLVLFAVATHTIKVF